MIPFVAILSTIETVALSAFLAPSMSFSSSDARMALRDERSFVRIWRLCSRRLTFCRFALRADFVRFATVLASSLTRKTRGHKGLSLSRWPRQQDVEGKPPRPLAGTRPDPG